MLRTRTSGASSGAATATTTPPDLPDIPLSTSPSGLLSITNIPAWYAENPFILRGYRPITPSHTLCLHSSLALHNQTVNIHTHLVPALLAGLLNVLFAGYFRGRFPGAAVLDQAVFHVHLTACAVCFGVSAAYHALLCHSRGVADLWVRLDYVCISVLILASFVPGLYMGFYCEPVLLRSYLTVIIAMGIFNAYLSMQDRFGAEDWLTSRLLPFLGLGFSALIPIAHAAMLFPYEQLQKQAGLNYYYLEGVLMMIGVAFLATKFPERWRPGTFDYWGASHQIFHCFVVLGAMAHFAGILSAYEWNYQNQRCTAAF